MKKRDESQHNSSLWPRKHHANPRSMKKMCSIGRWYSCKIALRSNAIGCSKGRRWSNLSGAMPARSRFRTSMVLTAAGAGSGSRSVYNAMLP